MHDKIAWLIKHVPFIQWIYQKVMSLCFRLMGIFIPVDDKLVILSSYGGDQYSDSPKVLFETMRSDPRFAGFHYVWAFGVPAKFDVPGGGPQNPHRLGTAVDFSGANNNLSVVARIAKKYGLYQPYPATDNVHFQLEKGAKPMFDGTDDESTKESIKAVENTAKETIAQEKKAEEQQSSIASSTDAAKQLVTERMPVTDTGVPTSGSSSGLQSVSSPVASFSTDTSVAGNVNNVDTNAEAQITEMRNSTDLLTQIRDILGAISKAEPAAVAAPAEPSKPVAMNSTDTDSISEAIRQGFSMILQDFKSGFNPASTMAMNPSPATQGSGQRSISSPVSFAKR